MNKNRGNKRPGRPVCLVLSCMLAGCAMTPDRPPDTAQAVAGTSSAITSGQEPDSTNLTQHGREGSRVLWIWISPAQRKNMPAQTAEYFVVEVPL